MSDLQVFEEIAAARWSDPISTDQDAWLHCGDRRWTKSKEGRAVGSDIGGPRPIYEGHLPRGWRLALDSFEHYPSTAVDEALDLADLNDGWNGPGSIGVTSDTAMTAAAFAAALKPSVAPGPTNSGEILYEWDLDFDLDLDDNVSIFAHAHGETISVTMFDAERTFVDVTMDAVGAAQLVEVLLTATRR